VTSAAFTPFAAMRERVQHELSRRAPDHLARLGWRREQIAQRQRDGLRALLAAARERSPFHSERLRGVDPARFELADLRELPVLTKALLMDAFDGAVTDRRVTRALAEAALAATRDEPQPLFDRFVCMSSGGSSGVRGVFVLDFEALVEFLMSLNRAMIRRSLAAGVAPGTGFTTATVAAGSAIHATGSATLWLSGAGPVRAQRVPVTLPLAQIVARLNEIRPLSIAGYPSVLARLAREQQEGRLAIAPRTITCTSENLLPEWRAAIADGFGVPVSNTYGSTEGLIGAAEPGEDAFQFNSDVCIVELVDADDQPVPAGTASAKILLTNLANHAQPLIRYEIDDQFVEAPRASDHGHLRASVTGRSGEVFRYGAIEIHALAIRSVLVRTPAVSDYQVRQTPRGIDLSALASGPVDTSALARELEVALAAAGLANSEVSVRRVDTLERSPDTGKLRRFVPLARPAPRS
jgi:phenylacetate-coenzyme A ligase PaaK-like adenylate-forming protein